MCGPEQVLVTEVTDALAGAASASLVRPVRAGEDPDAEIAAACCLYPEVPRLVLVRDAHRIRDWGFVPDAATASAAGGWVVFVSGDADFAPRPDKGQPRQPYPGVTAVRDAGGQAVRCVLADQDERIAWVQRRLPGVSATAAWEILARSGQDLGRAASACLRMRAAALPLEGRKWLDLVLDDHPDGDFADLLVLGKRTDALAAIGSLDPDDLSRVIGQLASRLDLMVTLYEAVQASMSMADIRAKLRVEQFLAVRFKRAAGDYDPPRVRRLRRLLAVLDAAVRSGARDGVAEALAALW